MEANAGQRGSIPWSRCGMSDVICDEAKAQAISAKRIQVLQGFEAAVAGDAVERLQNVPGGSTVLAPGRPRWPAATLLLVLAFRAEPSAAQQPPP